MSWLERLRIRMGMLFGRRNAAAQLDRELREHLQRQIDENLAAGMNPQDARSAALRAFGNPAPVSEQATWSWNGLESLVRDLRDGVRTMRRAPAFTAIAVVVKALGIGANVALFTVVRSVLLNPLPYRDPDRLVSVFEHQTHPVDPGYAGFMPIAGGSFTLWQKAAQDKARMAIVSPWHQYKVSAEGGKLPGQIDAAWRSGNFFSVLGVPPALGRAFTADDDRPGSVATVVLGFSFWKRRYNGDAGKILFDRLRPALVGLVLGLAASAAAVRLIQSMLYETDPIDPVVFTAVAATLLAVAMLACAVPAWRASRLDPMEALRTE
jgi:macrolide transport system ATP-binding/permease protein